MKKDREELCKRSSRLLNGLEFKLRILLASVASDASWPSIVVGLTVGPTTMDGHDASDASRASDASMPLKLMSCLSELYLDDLALFKIILLIFYY